MIEDALMDGRFKCHIVVGKEGTTAVLKKGRFPKYFNPVYNRLQFRRDESTKKKTIIEFTIVIYG